MPKGVRIGSILRDEKMWIAGAGDQVEIGDRITILRDGERIGTWDLAEISEQDIVTAMAGKELAEQNGWFMTRQFENEANPDMHARTTAREIVEDREGLEILQ